MVALVIFHHSGANHYLSEYRTAYGPFLRDPIPANIASLIMFVSLSFQPGVRLSRYQSLINRFSESFRRRCDMKCWKPDFDFHDFELRE
ncbi:hypothetical protein AVEN_175689-1 [Araneus ventricosus]|uniref:Uncharacterized protein n=1 Tax=Araneus ventricosus TaxID=182803 RepID=A0A4Y2F192_ARAVE|nr:hypothetical protein AVEN_175689-1 [Araneus ventricosus]